MNPLLTRLLHPVVAVLLSNWATVMMVVPKLSVTSLNFPLLLAVVVLKNLLLESSHNLFQLKFLRRIEGWGFWWNGQVLMFLVYLVF